MNRKFAALAVAAGLSACSPQDKARAHDEAEKAKVELRQGARQTAQDLKKAGNAIDHGAKELKTKVNQELKTTDTPDNGRDARQR